MENALDILGLARLLSCPLETRRNNKSTARSDGETTEKRKKRPGTFFQLPRAPFDPAHLRRPVDGAASSRLLVTRRQKPISFARCYSLSLGHLSVDDETCVAVSPAPR